MNRYICLLRGINVGGRIVKMAELKDCLEKTGLTNVVTVLQSGNVIFDSPQSDPAAIREQIEQAVSRRFEYPALVWVIPQSNLPGIIDHYPFDATDETFQHYVLFLRPGLASQLVSQAGELDPKMERLEVGGDDVAYWTVQKGMTLKSPFSKLLTLKPFKDSNTNRNIKTLRKLLA